MSEIIALFFCFDSTFIRNDDASVIPSCPHTAFDDRAGHNVKYLSLDWTSAVATALCKGFSTLLSLGLRFAGRFFALICLIVKVTTSS